MKRKIKDIIDPIRASEEDKEKILDEILKKRKSSRISLNKHLALVASFILILSTFFIKPHLSKISLPPDQGNPKLTDGNQVPLVKYDPGSIIPPFLEEEGSHIALKDLPKITFELKSESMGYAAIMLYNRDELENNNPWNEGMKLDKLPVFENEFPSNYMDLEDFIPRQKKDQLAKRIGKLLGIDDLEYRSDCYHGKNVSININMDLSSSIHWDKPINLPRTANQDEISRQHEYMAYYHNLYKDLFNFKEPQFELSYDYSYEGERNYNHYIYDGCGSDLERVLNYSFSKFRLGISEEDGSDNGLFVLHLPSIYRHKKIGDYPLISKDQAIENILDGNYLTTVPFDQEIRLEDIAKVEL